jgi:transcriptional regulator with XRE-family HTH domain
LLEQNHLLQRQLANALDIDTAMLSKIERGERRAKRKHIPIFAYLVNANEILKVVIKNIYANTKK